MTEQETVQHALPTERKFAVLLFADLSGYTQLCEQLDPEQVVAALHPVMASLRAAAVEQDGVICSTAGDGFFVSFGVPTAIEDAPYRAIAAADRMRAIIDIANAVERPVRIPPVHIGIAAGEVLVLPTQEAVGFSLVGSAVNLASRLCDAAPAGCVFVDEQTYAMLRARAHWAAPELLDVRGLGQVHAWPLARLGEPDSEQGAPSLFVGRHAELELLNRRLAAASNERSSQVVVVGGPAGMGKSRLVREWCGLRADVAHVSLDATAPGGCSLDALNRQLAPYLDGPAAHVETDLSELSLTADRPDPFPAVLAQTRRLLVEAAARSPFVLAIDDLHDADPTVQALVDDLRRHPLEAPVVCVATRRTGDGLDDPEVEVALDGLQAPDIAALVDTAWPRLESAALATALVGRVGGHPLMTLQVLAYLDENAGSTQLDDLPSSLRLFVASRLDRLPPSEKGLLQRLSTIGPRFRESDVERVLDGASENDLRRLVRRRLLRRTDSDGLEFDHGIVHEVAYMSLPRAERSHLHKRHLDSLPRGADAATRCFHALRWAESAVVDSPIEQANAAAAAMRESLELARELFRTQARSAHAGLARVTPLAVDASSAAPETAVQLLSLDARCLLEMWDFEAAEQSAARAVELASRYGLSDDVRLDAAIVHAMTLSRLRRTYSARAVIESVIATAEKVGDDVRRGRALRVLASTWRYESLSRFTALCEESYAVAHAAGDPAAVTTAQYVTYLHSTSAGRSYDRWRMLAESETAEDDRWGQATLARAATMRGIYAMDYVGAEAAAHQAVALGEELGAFDVVGDALLALVDVATALGRLAEVDPLVERLAELCEQTGNMRLQMFTWSGAARPLLRRGDVRQADQMLADATKLSEQFGPAARAELAYVTSLVHAERGRFHAALEALDRARDETADGPVALEVLLHRVREALVSVSAGLTVSTGALSGLVEECSLADAPHLASFARTVAALHGSESPLSEPHDEDAAPNPEERALRADTRALSAVRAGQDPSSFWKIAVEEWQHLGLTVFLARAQARAGDVVAAEQTLDAIGADDEGRNWALEGTAPQR